MYRASLFLFVVLGSIFGSATAEANTLRLPVSGDPAFYVDMPAGWTSNYDQYGNLQFTAVDHSTALQLSMDTDSRIATTTTDQMAANVMKAAGASPYTRSEPATLIGHAATAYYADMVIRNTHLNIKVVIAKLDDTHAAVETMLTKDGISPAQSALLSELIDDVRLTATK